MAYSEKAKRTRPFETGVCGGHSKAEHRDLVADDVDAGEQAPQQMRVANFTAYHVVRCP